MEKHEILAIVDRCLLERLARMQKRPAPGDVRKLSLTCQQVLFEVYAELRAKGAMGEAEDILRNENIKTAIEALPKPTRRLARDILICAHARIRGRGEK